MKWAPLSPRLALLWLASGLVLTGSMTSCGGCNTPTARSGSRREPKPPLPTGESSANLMVEEGLPEPEPAIETGVGDTSLLPYAGTVDDKDRQASTVMISFSSEPGVVPQCSGVLVAPTLALTAGSCVCERSKPSSSGGAEETRIDGSACEKQAYVTTVTHGAEWDPLRKRAKETSFHAYRGEVHPHPELEVILGGRGSLISSHADLAAIHLEEAVEEPLRFPSLANTETYAGEPLIMAGFARDDHLDTGGDYGTRYWRKNLVTQALPEGRVLYRQQGPYLYDGYLGGPCLRETEGVQQLVGIAGAGIGEELSCTSTVFFRRWLTSELSRAEITQGCNAREQCNQGRAQLPAARYAGEP